MKFHQIKRWYLMLTGKSVWHVNQDIGKCFPNVVLEDQCFNRPVASTTCVAVIKDIIQQGSNGYYCNIEDPDALADSMIKATELKNIENKYSMFDKEFLLNCFK